MKGDVKQSFRVVFLVILFLASSEAGSASEFHSEPTVLFSLGKSDNGRRLQTSNSEVADLNGDGLEDVVTQLFASDLRESGPTTPIRILLNDGAGGFVDGTVDLIAGPSPTAFFVRQFILEDFNGDGQLDIFVANHGREVGEPSEFSNEPNRLLLSGADGKLHDVTAENLPQLSDFSHGVTAADIDADGDIDVWVNNLSFFQPSYLLENDGNGAFSIVADIGFPGSEIVGLNDRLPAELVRGSGFAPPWSQFVDADNDGDPDLYLGLIKDFNNSGEGRSVLLLNDGTGRFTLAASDAIPAPPFGDNSQAAGSTTKDINKDGLQDLVIMQSNNFQDSGVKFQILISNGDGTFRDETALRLPPQPNQLSNLQIFFRDIDGDGNDDIVHLFSVLILDAEGNLLDVISKTFFLLNDGNGFFRQLPEDFVDLGFLAFPIDVDGDGGVDFLDGGGTMLNAAGETLLLLTKATVPYGPNLTGDSGNDRLIGGAFDNRFEGRGGDDFLDGGAGNDTLIGGTGNNVLTGGTGADRFVISPGAGLDTITDFVAGEDVLEFSGFAIAVGDLQIAAVGDDTQITLPSGEVVILSDIAPGDLNPARDFLVTTQTQLSNISTRGLVQTGDNVQIGGFIIGGTDPKTVLIRARGPVLADFGVPGELADPSLQLFSGQTLIAENDDWETTLPLCQNSGLNCGGAAEITATGLDPCVGNLTGCASEAAILVTLNPGPYTAIVSGVGGGTGVGLVEVFEVGTSTSRLTNISTRGVVGTGDDVMIGGFIIEGSTPKTVLVRARGPVLTDFGVPGELSDPFLQLFSGQTVIAQNDNWQTTDSLCGSPAVSCGGQAEIVATGLDPCVGNLTGCSQESAILVTLPPGPYTAIVSGVGGGTGVGLVEVFEVNP